jgi:hypothetical protein
MERTEMNPHDILPVRARQKLMTMAGAAADAREAASSAARRAADIQKQLGYAEVAADAANLEHELTRLKAVQQREMRRSGMMASLLANIDLWLSGVHPATVFKSVETTGYAPRKGEPLHAAITRLRSEIEEAQRDLRSIETAPLPKADQKKQAREYVAKFATQPKVHLDRGEFRVDFTGSTPGLSAASIAKLLAWFDPETMVRRLHEAIDALPEPELALTAAEKEKRVTDARRSLDQLERQEEGLISWAVSEGHDIVRRPNASPLAVLSIAVVERKAKAA